MLRGAERWLPGYLASVWRRRRRAGPRHVLFAVADHFEPFGYGAARSEALALTRAWEREYPRALGDLRDVDGRPPRHTFFYPQEAYDPECLGILASLCRQGFGEVEIHLHHRHDTADGLRAKLTAFRDELHGRHGLLGLDGGGRPRYGFVHGNWALCNSRPDGDWCGVDQELSVLEETGCYADFTFPSAPSPTQPWSVNAIYRACDRPCGPRGADRGPRVSASAACHPRPSPSGLMIVTGPLGLDWRRRKWGLLPRLDNGALTDVNPPCLRRARLWAAQQIHVGGRPDWIFVKVHAHGCKAGQRSALLGERARRFHEALLAGGGDGQEWLLHYVTTREMFNIIRAAEDGLSGDPGQYRDYEIGVPPGHAAR